MSNTQGINERQQPSGENTYLTPVNTVLVIVNVAVFIILAAIGEPGDAQFMYNHGAMAPLAVAVNHEIYRLFTCAFLHFDLSHLANNMVMLFFLGSVFEGAVGKVRYGIFYVVSCIGSSLVSYAVSLHQEEYLVVSAGASGAVFAIVGGLLWIVIRNRGHFAGISIKRILVMIVLTVYYGFTTTGVDNAAHVGGLVVGFAMAILLYRVRPRNRIRMA